jgi:tetratricopeptide (TPR) repeat protein
MAWVLHLAGRFEEAERKLATVIEVDPDFAMARFFLGRNHAAQGAWDRALEELESARVLSGGSAEVDSALGYTCARAGQVEEAEEMLLGLKERPGYVSPCLLAQVLTGLGDHEQAITELERAAEARAADVVWLAVAPAFEPLRDEPRVAALLAKAGL